MSEVNIVELPKDNKEEALQAIINYARQNPTKYALKKEALLKRYGITELSDEVVEVPESEDVKQLKAIKEKINKTVKKAVTKK